MPYLYYCYYTADAISTKEIHVSHIHAEFLITIIHSTNMTVCVSVCPPQGY